MPAFYGTGNWKEHEEQVGLYFSHTLVFQHGRSLKPVHQDEPITKGQTCALAKAIGALEIECSWFQRAGANGEEQSGFHGSRVSVLQSENVLGSVVEQCECI